LFPRTRKRWRTPGCGYQN